MEARKDYFFTLAVQLVAPKLHDEALGSPSSAKTHGVVESITAAYEAIREAYHKLPD